jgi:long-chain acyl-CoA synthetase
MGVLLSVPLFHVTGNQSFLALSTFAGAKVFLLYKWTIEGALKAVKDESLTIAGGVPFMVMQLIGGLDKSTTLNGVTFGGQSSSSLLPALLEEKLGSSFGGANQGGPLIKTICLFSSNH